MKLKDSPWKESYDNLDSIFKSRDITLPTKVCLVKAMVFPVVMYGCESWTVKKAERRRTDAFELWCWRRLLKVPWTARRSNQSILKEISPGYSLEGMMLKLKLQYFGHLMRRVDSLEKTLMLGRIGDRGWNGWMASLTRWTWVSVNSRSWWWTGRPAVLGFMGSQRVRHDWVTDLIWSDGTRCSVSWKGWVNLLLYQRGFWCMHRKLVKEEMATHPSILVERIPWTQEPGGLQCTEVAKTWKQLSDWACVLGSWASPVLWNSSGISGVSVFSSSACFCLMHIGSQISCYGKQICKHVITPKESAETEVWTADCGSPEGFMKLPCMGCGSWGVGGKCA